MRILIGYDGSPNADQMIDDLRMAGLPRSGDIVLVCIKELWLAYGNEITCEDLSQRYCLCETEALAARACQRLSRYFPEWHIKSLVQAGSPARMLLRAAEEWRPDLIVVGAHGSNISERVVFGSTAQKVLSEASCSVRVTRGGTQELLERWGHATSAWDALPDESPVRIVIGVDGSPGSLAAVHAVAGRNWPRGSKARLVTSVMVHKLARARVNAPTGAESEIVTVQNEAHDIQQVLKSELVAAGLDVSATVREGDPRIVLLDESERWSADVIFMGASGYEHLERYLLGIVTTSIATRAYCTVEVVRN